MSDYQCPACGGYDNEVLRTIPHHQNVRRRRRCKECGRRFSTEEILLEKPTTPLPVAFTRRSTRSIV